MKRLLSLFLFVFALADSALGTVCEELSPLVCLSSVKCTLDCERDPKSMKKCLKHGEYFCRREKGNCEMATSQKELTRESCEGDSRCRYEPANCFCACSFTKDCDCACGGGPPANCVER